MLEANDVRNNCIVETLLVAMDDWNGDAFALVVDLDQNLRGF
jgi:hypothetical protein